MFKAKNKLVYIIKLVLIIELLLNSRLKIVSIGGSYRS